MRFFDREKEVELLKDIHQKSQTNAQFTVLTGRRRIGKTTLVFKAYENHPIIYLFVSRKSEKDLCRGFLNYPNIPLPLNRKYVNPNCYKNLYKK